MEITMLNRSAFTVSFNLALKRSFVFLLALCFILGGSVPGARAMDNVLYSKPEAIGAGDCSTWENACALRTALTNAVSGDQIWVMEGRHIPTTTGDRSASFQLKDGVAVYGGFDGTETSLDQRDWVSNVTILSGDLLGDDEGFTNNGENSYHVVYDSFGPVGSYLDGITISSGNANGGYGYGYGGGMTNVGTLFNKSISSDYYRNRDSTYNGPTLINVIFRGNMAQIGGGMAYFSFNANLENVTFAGNLSNIGGGGMYLSGGSSTFTNVTFSSNHAFAGGGLEIGGGNPVLTNVTFTDNSVSYNGGGISNWSAQPTLINVTFFKNVAYSGGGALYNKGGSVALTNSVLWGDSDGEILNVEDGNTTVNFSIVQGGYEGTGNIDADPLLAPLWDYGGEVESNAILPGSPVIDATSSNCPTTDARGVIRSSPNCDLGAFESQGFSLEKVSGDDQTAYIYGYFDLPLCVAVTANDILEPVNGGKVSFIPPTSGPSAIFANNPAPITNGESCTIARANGIAGGPYEIMASAAGGTSVTFNLTNISGIMTYLAVVKK